MTHTDLFRVPLLDTALSYPSVLGSWYEDPVESNSMFTGNYTVYIPLGGYVHGVQNKVSTWGMHLPWWKVYSHGAPVGLNIASLYLLLVGV